jgi:hypothetical protein
MAIASGTASRRFYLPICGRPVRAHAMRRCTFWLALVCLAVTVPCGAASLSVELFPLTGEVRFQNPSASAVPFVFYRIKSPGGFLNPGGWTSIADYHDLSGDGFIDPSTNWTELSTTSTQIAEGAFAGTGGSLPAFRSLSLGYIWFPFQYPNNDLEIDILQAGETKVMPPYDTQLAPPYGQYQFAVAGDYNSNGVVNSADYTVWRQSFASTTDLAADGNLNGVVDAADYVIWRDNLGKSLPPMGSSTNLLLGAGIVPEPSTLVLLLAGASSSLLVRRGRARHAARLAAQRRSVFP